MILYGIPTCDTCRKAQKALVAAGHEITFRDVRAAPLTAAERAEFLSAFGDSLLNRASTTWRALDDIGFLDRRVAHGARAPATMARTSAATASGIRPPSTMRNRSRYSI